MQTYFQLKKIASREKLPNLGRHYRLKVDKQPLPHAAFQFNQGRFIATVPREWKQEQIQQRLEQKLIQRYHVRGLKKVIERAKEYQSMLGVEPRSLQLKTQHKRWDIDAVENAFIFSYSNGLAETSVNKLKTIKRILFGRSNSDLL